jgi:hypothetical protein
MFSIDRMKSAAMDVTVRSSSSRVIPSRTISSMTADAAASTSSRERPGLGVSTTCRTPDSWEEPWKALASWAICIRCTSCW